MRFFCILMIRKIKNSYYLNRVDAIEYLIHAYDLKWCMTRWNGNLISINFQTKTNSRKNVKVLAYFLKPSKQAWLSKRDLDLEMLKICNK